LFLSLVQAGYPSPADGAVDQTLDLNEHIFRNPEMTIMVRMKGDFFKSQGVFHRDMIIADCSQEPRDGQLVVAMIDGEELVRRLSRRGQRVFLVVDDGPAELIEIGSRRNVRVVAAVTHTIHILSD
jgi:DNA polymerase V